MSIWAFGADPASFDVAWPRSVSSGAVHALGRRRASFTAVAACACVSALAGTSSAAAGDATSVALPASADTTIFDDGGVNGNGAGDGLFTGRNGNMGGAIRRRSLIQFDLTVLPPDAQIQSVVLELVLVQGQGSASLDQTLHRALASWGEGPTVGGGGLGAPAAPGDATWIHRVLPRPLWATPGGDFDPTPSASTAVDSSETVFAWSSPDLAADVQGWLDDPASNVGWFLLGDESTPSTSRRFASRDHPDPALHPNLVIDYVRTCPADVDLDGSVAFGDLTSLLAAWGTDASDADLDGSGTVGFGDLTLLLAAWGPCP